MEPSELKTYAEIAQIAVSIAALVVGGAWALYGLIIFRRRQAAITDLRKAEAEAVSLELAARRRAVLDIAIQHESRPDLSGEGYILTIQLVINNEGVAPARMQFEGEEPALRIQRVDFDDRGMMSFPTEPMMLRVRNASDPGRDARGRVIRAGGVSRLPMVVRVPKAGVYAISFRAPMDETNRQAMIEAGANPNRRLYWSANAFACVGIPVEDVNTNDV